MNQSIIFIFGYKNNYVYASRFGLQKQNLLGYKNIFFGLQKQKESAGYKNVQRVRELQKHTETQRVTKTQSYKMGYKTGYKSHCPNLNMCKCKILLVTKS